MSSGNVNIKVKIYQTILIYRADTRVNYHTWLVRVTKYKIIAQAITVPNRKK